MTYTNPTILTWFRRRTGAWSSQRRYLFAPKMKPTNMTTEFTIGEGERGNIFIVKWTGVTQGDMELVLEGNICHRSRNYLSDGADPSVIEVIDEDALVFKTEYDGMKIREEIRLLQSDTLALRQTVSIDKKTQRTVIVGQYYETRTL